MLSDDMSSIGAKITAQIIELGGSVDAAGFERIFADFGITRQKKAYKGMLVNTGYLYYDELADRYRVTAAGGASATITITVARLYAKRVQRHVTQALAAQRGIVEVGEVEV